MCVQEVPYLVCISSPLKNEVYFQSFIPIFLVLKNNFLHSCKKMSSQIFQCVVVVVVVLLRGSMCFFYIKSLCNSSSSSSWTSSSSSSTVSVFSVLKKTLCVLSVFSLISCFLI